jgi:hypothetical protein
MRFGGSNTTEHSGVSSFSQPLKETRTRGKLALRKVNASVLAGEAHRRCE